jgi:hypothetical protein
VLFLLELPKNALGKVVKPELLARIVAGSSADPPAGTPP